MISFFIFYAIILCKEDKNMKPNIEELRKKYMDHPPEGFTSEDIRNMSEDELLDMDYFLNEDDLFSDEAGVEGFLYLLTSAISLSCSLLCGLFSFMNLTNIELSYKVKKVVILTTF